MACCVYIFLPSSLYLELLFNLRCRICKMKRSTLNWLLPQPKRFQIIFLQVWEPVHQDIDHPNFIVFSTYGYEPLTFISFIWMYILLSGAMIICIGCCIWSFRVLQKLSSRLSAKTMKQQKDYLRAVTVQVVELKKLFNFIFRCLFTWQG